MINEFFKSIFRTLGRIAAYVLLGVLAYFLFSWFSHVDAQTINVSNYHIEGLDKNSQITQNCFNCNQMITDSDKRIIGWEYYPMDNSWNYIGINSGTYILDYEWTISTAYSDTDNKLSNTLPTIRTKVKSGNNMINATCDGSEAVSHVDRTIIDNVYFHTFRYQCSKLNVTQNFSQVGVNVYFSSFQNLVLLPQSIRGFTIQFSSFLDDNSTDTEAIILNNNINTQNIINSISDLEGDLQEVNSSLLDLNDNLNDNFSDLNSTILSSDDIDTGFLSDIFGMSPSTTPVTNILTLPTSILNKEISQVQNGTCSAWNINFGQYFNNYTLTFPCLNISQYFTFSIGGYTIWQIIDLMICLGMGYEIAMLIVSIFNSILNLDDTFSSLYVPRHEYTGYKPKHGGG